MKLLNLGCGEVFHPAWINIDIHSNSEHVRAYDLRKGIPFESESFDAVYHSHVLEHIKPKDIPFFLSEIKRVLKPGGTIRVVVPDLEKSVRGYLENLGTQNYDWMILELLDQLTRDRSGGSMAEYIRNKDLKNKDFILARMGDEVEKILKIKSIRPLSPWEKLKGKKIQWYWNKLRISVASSFLFLIGGRSYQEIFSEGLFRRSGEVHQWMYDQFSLSRLLERNGFSKVELTTAFKSQIPQFETYQLDARGKEVRKPDSLFIEAQK